MRSHPASLPPLSTQSSSASENLSTIAPGILRTIFDTDRLPIVLIASDGISAETSFITMELAREAAEYAYRVLVIECARPDPVLAGMVCAKAKPTLVRVNGMTFIALPEASGGDLLYVSPALSNPQRLVAGLSAREDIRVIADAAKHFDLILIDGGTRDPHVRNFWLGFANNTLQVSHCVGTNDQEFGRDLSRKSRRFLGTIVAFSQTRPSNMHQERKSAEASRASNQAMARLYAKSMRPELCVDNDGARRAASY